ncbi:putative disease resistance protein RGA4 [Miscanthus floridulus]|uniref:putative disease resistance protein RGA4 n=1 Tax=Miscanthus floridulus TaxID=154761 RepID=UPI003457BFA9
MSLSKAIGVIGVFNEFGNLFQLVTSAVSYMRSKWNGSQEKQQLKQEDLLQLQSDLQRLTDTLPAMYNLIDRAEWRIHVPSVAQLLPKLKDAVYDAEDLLDEFRWYKLKLKIEGNNDESQMSPLIDFFHSVTHGSFNKVTDIQTRLSHISAQLEKMGMHEATPRFDKLVRPPTTSFRTEPNILGRDKELKEVMRLLGVPAPDHGSSSRCRSTSKRKRTASSAADSTEPIRIPSVPVLPIVGIGGVGKTTLAQEITTLPSVKSHFDNIIWICVSDDFDEERFTKVLIKSLSRKEATADNLDDLQQVLAEEAGKRRFLLILDDIWPAALNDGQCWRKFCAPLTKVLKGSMLLVTTRFAEVADIVGTVESFVLEGLKEDVFWDFFKLCVFGSEDSHIDPQLEQIGKSILVKLKGTPLAAKTIGRLLQKSLTSAHWNDILNNELWQIEQKETDILPALRLSYMYLPFRLKRCFSFCAVYPKDYNFKKDILAEIWVAEGFVEPRGSSPLQHIGEQYFEDLVNLSFFHKLRGKYVIHDLMHDMALLVSKDECFIVKNTSGIEKVPPSVRHLSILSSSGVKCSDLMSLCKHTKLRTLLCNKYFRSEILSSLMDCWFDELGCLRVFFCAFKLERLPERIDNLKHLRYLGISRKRHFIEVPSSFWSLYNLQILSARKCTFQRLHIGASKLINLQKFESRILEMKVDAKELGEQIGFINNFPDIKDLVIYNLSAISKDHAAMVELRKRKDLTSLTLSWFSLRSPEHNEIEVLPEHNEIEVIPLHNVIEVLQALQPPTNVKSVCIQGYPGEYFPTWFSGSDGLNAMPFSGTFLSSVTQLSIEGCQNLRSCRLDVPAVRKIEIAHCRNVKSVRIEHLEDSTFSLQELKVYNCPNITYLLAPSIRKLEVKNSGNLGDSVDCNPLTILSSSLTELSIDGCQNLSDCRLDVPAIRKIEIAHCRNVKSVRIEHLEDSTFSLQELKVYNCPNITYLLVPSIRKLELKNYGSLGDSNGCSSLTILSSSLTELSIDGCQNLSDCRLDVPAIRKIEIWHCRNVKSVRIEHLEDSTFSLQELMVFDCPNNTHHLLAPSIRKLELNNSGNLGDSIDCSSLTFLHLSCDHLTSMDLQKWSLPLLQELYISICPCLISIRDSEQVHTDVSLGWARRRSTGKFPFLTHLAIGWCPKLETLDGLLTHEYLPAIKDLTIMSCPRLNWQSGMMLPSSIQRLQLHDSGNISRSCLVSHTSTSLQEPSG